MRQSFLLAWRTLVRGYVLLVLLLATVLDHALLPALVRANGTADGWREMFVRVVPGSVFVFTCLALLACACGLFARDREASRLALSIVRPVSAFSIACGKWLALCAVGACALGFNAVLTGIRLADAPACFHHVRPTLPSAAVVAHDLLEDYLKDPKTPERVKKAPRSTVLALLASKESDRYDVVAAGASVNWPFPTDTVRDDGQTLVRVRFATAYELRAPLRGRFVWGANAAAVSNATQSVLTLPLVKATNSTVVAGEGLTFTNTGTESVMLRPRRDLELLNPADAFLWNLLRASLQMFATVALLAAFGLFLSSALSRPVAVFTALVVATVALMAPGVVEQFPDELGTSLANRIGLAFARAVQDVTSAATAATPVSDLATDTCIERRALFVSFVRDALAVPFVFLALSAVLARRKPLPDRF